MCCQAEIFQKCYVFQNFFVRLLARCAEHFFKVWFVLLAHGSFKNKNPLHEKIIFIIIILYELTSFYGYTYVMESGYS